MHVKDEKTHEDGGVKSFQLGERYEGVDPSVGILHDARLVKTGKAVLVLIPGERLEWQFEGPWRVEISCQLNPPAVILDVKQSPVSMPMTELTTLLILMKAAVEYVEDNPRVRAHFVSTSARPLEGWRPRVRALAGVAVLALGLGVWLYGRNGARHSQDATADGVAGSVVQTEMPDFFNLADAGQPSIAYPMPAKPFKEQAVPPCETERGVVEINGGCWMELAQRAPCMKGQAEHEGRCYMAILKRERPPQAVQPTE